VYPSQSTALADMRGLAKTARVIEVLAVGRVPEAV
jgi:hypothetical protein